MGPKPAHKEASNPPGVISDNNANLTMKKLGFLTSMIISAYLLVCALGYLGFTTSRTNLLGWFLVLTAVAYGISGPFLLRDTLVGDGIIRREHQDRSFWVILPGFLSVFYGAPLEWLYLPPLLPATRTVWMQIIGFVLIAGGIAMLCWARFTLKDLYSGRVQVLAGHRLIRSGPYHFIRHPAYTSYIIMCLGIAIGYSSLIGLLSVPLLLVPGLIYRIEIEEKLLSLEFGDQYTAYAKDTRRLIPHIW